MPISTCVFDADATPFDVAAARATASAGHGFHTVWVNRASDPVERLSWRPAETLSDLARLPAIAKAA